ncbi:hypothetical protein [Arthrobacter caoxuetaonis]|uniref:Lipoprotein n=1 Tax=Arthrobacter caoxuetaonis TaxID=2886935 RepID=A0A9X1SGS3_9MICC|nr:hypothetical protein [Arthrobacter caoxuetaonis]MCC3299654.1 hypothetical protein [Arthrobacter caoxuetaonis]USQ59004.1 hypothetical protein NF551_18025 [Arthrobacter caoxuetaonis]
MNKKTKAVLAFAGAAVIAATASGCTASQTASYEVNAKANSRSPYLPKNDVEFENYNEAQKLFDDPNSIIWCTSTLPNDSSPIFTVPIRGKLTSSSTSYFRGTDSNGYEERSVDGMYHGSPPAYRFGFTPMGDYVSFEGMEVYCSSKMDSFQRQETYISVDPGSDAVSDAQKKAEEALKAGNPDEAMRLLSEATSGMGLEGAK